jgi:hypothetical protein
MTRTHMTVSTPTDFQLLDPTDWRNTLGAACKEMLSQKHRIVVCVTGKTGTGKTTLGRSLRKEGLPGIPARHIAVLDDGTLSHIVLGIWHRRIRIPSQTRDELTPFEPYLKRKRVLVYVNGNPGIRLSACDIRLHLLCPEDLRHQRLLNRNVDGEQRYQRSIEHGDPPDIPARLDFSLNVG